MRKLLENQLFLLPVVLLFGWLSVHNALSQDKSGTSPTPSRRSSFEERAFTVGPRFQGDGPTGIFNHLTRIIPNKSEFESSEAYLARAIAQVNNSTFPGGNTSDGVFAFVIPPDKVLVNYNADEETIRVAIAVSSPAKGYGIELDHRYKLINLWARSSIVRKAPASNVFGARTLVTYVQTDSFGIAFDKALMSGGGDGYLISTTLGTLAAYDIPMSPLRARSVKSKLGVLVTAKLSLPFVSANTRAYPATIDHPRSTSVFERVVYVQPRQFWVYDKTSGTVHFKIDIQDGRTSYSRERAENERQLEAEQKIVEASQAKARKEAEELRAKELEGLEPITILSRPQPKIPNDFDPSRGSTRIKLSVTFLASGSIGQITPVDSANDEALVPFAIEAAKQIRFEPARKYGVPVDTVRTVEYVFRVSN